jgi:hypothetical protein
VAAEEDFGIAAVEAQAAGKPVIAFGRGGSLETVEAGVTGVFFREHSEGDVLAAFAACERLESSPESIAGRARRFSAPAFRERLASVLAEALAQRVGAPTSRRGQDEGAVECLEDRVAADAIVAAGVRARPAGQTPQLPRS